MRVPSSFAALIPLITLIAVPQAFAVITAPSSVNAGTSFQMTWEHPAQPYVYGNGQTYYYNQRPVTITISTPGTYTYTEEFCFYYFGYVCTTVDTHAIVVNFVAPGVPGAISGPSSSSNGSYAISWAAASGIVSTYQLQEQVNSGSWSTIQNTSSRSRSFSGKSTATYRYRVRAGNPDGCSSWTSTKTITVLLPPSVPTGLAAPASNATGAYAVSWNSATTATSYQLRRKLNSGSWSTIQNSSATSRSESGRSNGTWGYSVRACNSSGCSAWSSTKSVAVLHPPPVPGGLSAPASSNTGSFSVSWSSAATATYYQLNRRLNGGSWSTIHNAGGTTKAESGLGEGTWEYLVRACNGGGCSGWSGLVSVTVEYPPPVPTGLSGPSSSTDGSFTVSWNASSGATSYALRRRVDAGAWTTVQTSSSTSRSESVLANGGYDYAVQACVGALCSAWSASIAVTVLHPPAMPAEFECAVNGGHRRLYRVLGRGFQCGHAWLKWTPKSRQWFKLRSSLRIGTPSR